MARNGGSREVELTGLRDFSTDHGIARTTASWETALAVVTTEEIEAFLPVAEVYLPRLLRMQVEPQPLEDDAHSPFGFPERLRRATEHDKVVRVAHQHPNVGALAFPHGIEKVQVDVGEQRRADAPLRRPRDRLGVPPLLHRSCPQPPTQQLQHLPIRAPP